MIVSYVRLIGRENDIRATYRFPGCHLALHRMIRDFTSSGTVDRYMSRICDMLLSGNWETKIGPSLLTRVNAPITFLQQYAI